MPGKTKGIRQYPVCFGTERGLRVTKFKRPQKPSRKRGVSFFKFIAKVLRKGSAFTKNLIREVVGFAPFERRVIELLKTDREKRALKFTKKRIGGHKRAKRKREELAEVARR